MTRQSFSYRGPSYSKCQEICERSNCDGSSSSPHGEAEPLCPRLGLLLGTEVVEALHGDEHVVDTDAKEEEGDHIVQRAVGEANQGTESIRESNRHGNTSQTQQRQISLKCVNTWMQFNSFF